LQNFDLKFKQGHLLRKSSWNGNSGTICIYKSAAHFNVLCFLRPESVLNLNPYSLDICIFREAEYKAELTLHEVCWVSLGLTYLQPGPTSSKPYIVF
jgi:hypothetical protein